MPAYTHRATGTVASNSNSALLSPGAPAGVQVGDLLIMPTAAYTVSATILTEPTGWTQIVAPLIADNPGPTIAIYARVADGTANDTPTVRWNAGNDTLAAISAFSGDVYTDLATIIAHSASSQITGTNNNLGAAALTISTNDTMVVNFTVRRKTATSNDATTVSHAQFTKRWQEIQTGTALVAAFGSLQQTTAANYDGTVWTRDGTAEAGADVNITLALKTQAAAAGITRLTRSKLLKSGLLYR